MSGRARVRALACMAAALCALPTLGDRAAAGGISDKIRAQQAQMQRVQDQLDRKRALLQFQRTRANDLQHQLDETDAGIAHVGAALGRTSNDVAWNERKLAWNQVQLDAAEATLQRHNDALRRRLVDVYERGELGYVNVLLSATSFADFVERWDDIHYVIAANQRTLRERKAAEGAVARARLGLESERYALGAALAEQQREKYALASLATQRAGLLQVAEIARRAVSSQVTQLEDLSAAEESQLEALIRERQREIAAERAAEEAQRRRAAQLAGRELPPATTPGAPGSFAWPVSGPITSPFGMRPNPLGQGFEMHPGIDIGAPMGATVTATAGGRIIWAKPYGGYGNAIIIDHGGNTSSVYGHLSAIFVSEGQDVTRGQAIGAVGCTGRCTGPHLHFEIRVNGVAVDPTGRLR